MAENKNIDSLLVSSNQANTAQAEINEPEKDVNETEVKVEVKEEATTSQVTDNEYEVENEKPVADTKVDESDNDEYGNPIVKSRMYSEEEVQRMIRDRLSRGQHTQQQHTQSEVNQAAKGFEADPNSSEPWQQQLAEFIDKRLDQKKRETQEREWQHQEKTRQADFESKFTTGMARYKDFHEVVSGKPLTNSMMLATRNMKDPAAFVYAAAKTQAKELERISNIQDPYQQAAEIGRLEEKMKKARAAASSSPRPLDNTKGDMVEKGNVRPNIDARIHQYGRNKFRR